MLLTTALSLDYASLTAFDTSPLALSAYGTLRSGPTDAPFMFAILLDVDAIVLHLSFLVEHDVQVV